ncbi:MAG: FtsW/RodA/SpoVE family cell cycle protein [Clostridia bacterium]|nr:FtsW/RodA/SpoVE family cell cycle protein [Clostridia bacterium]
MKQEILAYFGVLNLIKDLFTGKKKLKDCVAKGPMDITFLALVIALLTVGIVMMFSASYVNAWYDSSPTVNNDPYYYVKNQILFAVIGVALMIGVSFVKTDVFRDVSGLITVIAFLLLVYVLINPYIVPGKEQFKRWVEFPIIGSFQPSEIAKLALIMFLAFSMERHHKLVEKHWWMIIPYMGVIAVFCGLVYLENHVSGTILMLGIGVATMYFGGVRIHWSVYVIGIAAVVIAVIFFALNADKFLEGYASERIRIWLKLLTGEELTSAETRGSGWQSLQSLYAIGSGGLFGLGFGNSKQKHMYLPEPQNDFVFAIVCEELGFFRALIIILLFILLVGRGFIIGLRARSRFEAMLAMGISFHVGLQAALNIAVVTATVPNTGISLPFFSYGGTALVILLFEMGIVLSISRNSERKNKNVR